MDQITALLHNGIVLHLCLLALCAAYIQGPVTKILDFQAATEEMIALGLAPPRLLALGTICFELTTSAMVIFGWYRPLAALALAGYTMVATLIALRFWEQPKGLARTQQMDAFFEHIGLSGAFVLVALMGF